MPWIIAAATIGSALIQSNASKKAAQSQSRAAEQATEQQRAMYDISRADLTPWRGTGELSLQTLSYLMGIDPRKTAGFEKPSPVPTSPLSFASDAGQPLFDIDGKPASPEGYGIGGVPTVNQARYESDPIYRSAWDKHLATHQQQYGVGYTGDSDQMALAAGLKQLMAQERTAQGLPTEAEQMATETAAFDENLENDPNFGLLAKPFREYKPFTLADFQESPAYQFNLAEGRKALEKSAAARGTYYAPATLQDIGKFSQGLASNEFNNAYGMFNQDYSNAYNAYNTNMRNVWDRLYALSGSGQNAAAQTGAFGTTVGGQIGENIIGAGNARAAGQIGQANAWTNAGTNAYNAYLMNQMLAQNQRGTSGNQPGTGSPSGGYSSGLVDNSYWGTY